MVLYTIAEEGAAKTQRRNLPNPRTHSEVNFERMKQDGRKMKSKETKTRDGTMSPRA